MFGMLSEGVKIFCRVKEKPAIVINDGFVRFGNFLDSKKGFGFGNCFEVTLWL